MKKIAFLTSEALKEMTQDDRLLAVELQASGEYEVNAIPWTAEVDWSSYEAIIIRSTWDYTDYPEDFLLKLKKIEEAGGPLLNPAHVVEWNHHKGYLFELQKKGVQIVPSLATKGEEVTIPADWDCEQLVLKPLISASAKNTFVIKRHDLLPRLAQLEVGEWLVQPFLPEINEGEISLFFFSDVFSHAVLKVPGAEDFRVQEEHGGKISAFFASAELVRLGKEILSLVGQPLLYARVDLVQVKKSYLLMELELIEPSLYFRCCPTAPENFRRALQKFLK